MVIKYCIWASKMELYQIDSHSKINREPVKSITNRVIYYVSSGRNAWHGTWVGQYKKGCMHTSLRSAKEYAEKNRASGTVFYINQIPCLVFRSERQALLVTEINSNNPLLGYSCNSTSDALGGNSKKINGALDNYMSIGAPLNGVGLSFLSTSRFWEKRPSPKNSIMLLSHSDSRISLEKLCGDGLLAYEAFSNGGQYLLGWREIKSEIASSKIIEIIKSKKEGLPEIVASGNENVHEKQSGRQSEGSSAIGNVHLLVDHVSGHRNEAFVRLRKMNEGAVNKNSASATSSLINGFLDELGELLSHRVINNLNDGVLNLSYKGWLGAVLCGADREGRIDWLMTGIHFFAPNYTSEA